ncbi:hypothetical protein U9M48_026052, partial [Paspalum notatum var. saurae]
FRERRTNAEAVTNPVVGRRARAPGAEDGVSPIKPSPFQGVARGKASQPDKLKCISDYDQG